MGRMQCQCFTRLKWSFTEHLKESPKSLWKCKLYIPKNFMDFITTEHLSGRVHWKTSQGEGNWVTAFLELSALESRKVIPVQLGGAH